MTIPDEIVAALESLPGTYIPTPGGTMGSKLIRLEYAIDLIRSREWGEPKGCQLPHRKNASARLITGKWGDATGVNFCFGCGASLKESE